MSLTAFGVVEELIQTEQDFRRLTVTINTPFKTHMLRFNQWDSKILQKNTLGELYTKGDGVKIEYREKDKYLFLDSLTLTDVEHCPVCHSTLAVTDALRTDCHGCRSLPLDQHKDRVDRIMTLISVKVKQYAYSNGYRLELQAREDPKSSYGVIFPNSKLYPLMQELRVGDSCKVVGWKLGKLLDIIDFCIL